MTGNEERIVLFEETAVRPSKYESWEAAGDAAICLCGNTWNHHYKWRPLTLACRASSGRFTPREALRVVEHEVNRVTVYADQWGRPLEEVATISYRPSRMGWRRLLRENGATAAAANSDA